MTKRCMRAHFTATLLVFWIFSQSVSVAFARDVASSDRSVSPVSPTVSVPDRSAAIPLVAPSVPSAVPAPSRSAAPVVSPDSIAESGRSSGVSVPVPSPGSGSKKTAAMINNPQQYDTWARGKGPRFEMGNSIGASTYAYPLDIPSGRLGVQPSLTLTYNSESRDNFSPYGYGWSMDTGYIVRDTRRGKDFLYKDNAFSLNIFGNQKRLAPLSLVDATHGSYGEEIETDHYAIQYANNDSWLVTDKNGTTYLFGASSAARQDHPQDASKIYKWMLQEIRDTHDNFVRFTYVKNGGQIYPEKIFYTGSGAVDGSFTVTFTLEARPDTFETYASQFLVTNAFRVKEVQAAYNGEWRKKYTFAYMSGANSKRSLLQSITATAQDNSGAVSAMPATTFSYNQKVKSWDYDPTWKLPVYFYDEGSGDSGARFVDVNGDGLTDIVRSVSTLGGNSLPPINDVYINTGSGWVKSSSWSVPVPIILAGIGQNTDSGARFADVNGDGLTDVIGGQMSEVYLNTGKNWVLSSQWNFPLSIIANQGWLPRGVELADVNGDGFVDVIHAHQDSPREVFINDTKSSWKLSSQWIFPTDFLNNSAQLDKREEGVRLVDVNGDGLIDVVQARKYFTGSGGYDDINSVWINTGFGWVLSARKVPSEALIVDHDGKDQGVRFADINGDGLTDLVKGGGQYDNGSVKIFLNSGAGWYLDSGWKFPMQGFNDLYGIPLGGMLVDVNGDGLPDIANGKLGPDWDKMYINHFATSGVVDDLLVNLNESQGAKTALTYRPSPWYKDASGAALNPLAPVPAQTVVKAQTDDGFGNAATTSYVYSGASYYVDAVDPYKNAFAGFGVVTANADDGTSTKTYYYQGNKAGVDDHYAKIGRSYRRDILGQSGAVEKRDFSSWAVQTVPSSLPQGSDRYVLNPASNVSVSFDGGSPQKSSAVGYAFDTDGNITQENEYGEVSADAGTGAFSDIGGDKKTRSMTYASDSAGKIRGAVFQETLKDANGAIVRDTRFFYDGFLTPTVGKYGDMTRKEAWSNTKGAWIASLYTFDSYGHRTSETDPLGAVTKTAYDAANLYPVAVTNPKNQVTAYGYDAAVGKPTLVTDPNGVMTKTQYDGFGRVVKVLAKHSSLGADFVALKEFVYNDQIFPHSTKELSYDGNGGMQEQHTYVNGYGLNLQTRRKMTNGNYAVVRTTYDTKRRPSFVAFPVEESGSAFTGASGGGGGGGAVAGVTTAYDTLDRVTSVTTPAGKETTAYHGWDKDVTDGNGHKKGYHFDAFERLIGADEFWQGAKYTTAYAYDGLGNVLNITDAKGNVRNFSYDSLSRRTVVEDLHQPGDATFGTVAYAYDDAGNLIKRTNADGKTITFTYDALRRVLTEKMSDAASDPVTYAYDTAPNGVGLLASVQKKDVTTSYGGYDVFGRVTSESRTIGGQTFAFSKQYDFLGRLTSATAPNGVTISYTYGPDGLYKIDRKVAGAGSSVSVVSGKTYNPKGQVASVALSNGVQTTYAYDAAARLIAKATKQGSGAVLQNLSYQYDAVGNVTALQEAADTKIKKQAAYMYDELDRLISATVTGTADATGDTAPYTFAYTYDILGNVLSKPLGGVYTYGQIGFANPHAVTQMTGTANGKPVTENFSYDQNGNLIQDGTRALSWNAKNELQKVIVGGNATTFAYDQTGGRVSKTSASGATLYPDASYEVEDVGGKKIVRNYVYDGSELVATIEDGNPPVALPPPLASATTTTVLNENFDNAAQVASTWKIQSGKWKSLGDGTYFEQGSAMAKSSVALAQDGASKNTYAYQWKQTFISLPVGNKGVNGSGAGAYVFVRDPNVEHGNYSYLLFQDNEALHLYRAVTNGGKTTLTELGNGLAPLNVKAVPDTHTYKLLYVPSTGLLRAMRDGQGVIVTKDTSPITYPGKYVTFLNNAARIAYDNLAVAVTVPPPPSSPPQPQPQTGGASVVYHTHTDHLGSSSVVTLGLNFDGTSGASAGSIVEQLDFYPYGETRVDQKAASFATKKGYTGKELDTATNLSYYGARYYDSRLGRFISEDPSFQDLSDSRSFSNPQGWNSYSYALDNPVRYTDPDGRTFAERMWGFANGMWDTGSALVQAAAHPIHTSLSATFQFASNVSFLADYASNHTFSQFTSDFREGLGTMYDNFDRASEYDKGHAIGSATFQAMTAAAMGRVGMSGVAGESELGVTADAVASESVNLGEYNFLKPTLERIQRGEKFPHVNDGSVHFNRERFLPEKPEGYYREYVHPTPGKNGVWKQRIIIGKEGEIYYSPDHYKSPPKHIK